MRDIIYNRNIMEKDGFYVTVNIRGANVGGVGVTYSAATEFGIVFIAKHPCEVLQISEAHKVATTGSCGIVKRENGGSSDLSIHTNFSLTGAAYTTLTKSGTDLNKTNSFLKAGDMLVSTGSGIANDANINMTIYLKPSNQGNYR